MNKSNYTSLKYDISNVGQKLVKHQLFCNSKPEISIVKNKSTASFTSKHREMNNIINTLSVLEPEYVYMEDNITKLERNALDDLVKNEEIIIKKADKGGCIVIMDTDWYKNKLVLETHLYTSTYTAIPAYKQYQVIKNLNNLIKKYKSNLTEKEIDYLTKFTWKTSNFYVLPKIHKSKKINDHISLYCDEYIECPHPDDLKSRPIVAGPESPTQRLCELLEILLRPFVIKSKSYIKDDWDFVRHLPGELNERCNLFPCDIVSLYTSIPHALGIEAVIYWLNKYPNLISARFSLEFIINSLKFVLTNNNFIFDNQLYHQNTGTGMGIKCAPSYACLTISFLEETCLYPKELPKYFPPNICAAIENNYKRYVDDGFTPLPENASEIHLQQALNNLHPSIIFTVESSKKINTETQILNFLDIMIELKNNLHISTDIYYKSTNSHDYLHYNSCHPISTIHNIPFNLAKRIIVFVSNEAKVETRLSELKQWLKRCNFPEDIIDKGFHNAKLQGPAPNPNLKRTIIPLTTTYYPQLQLNSTVKTINSMIQNIQDPKLKSKFDNTKVILARKQPNNLLRLLTKAKFSTTPLLQKPGFHPCHRANCKLCHLYFDIPGNEFITSNGTKWELKTSASCHTKNIVYFLSCTFCNGRTTYIGRTEDIHFRMNNHISKCRHKDMLCTWSNHIAECCKKKTFKEPFFKINIFLILRDNTRLQYFEDLLFNRGHAILR